MSGRPIVRGTRILPDAIVDSYDLGESIEELEEARLVCRANQAADRVCPRAARAADRVRVLLDENLDHALRKLLGSMTL